MRAFPSILMFGSIFETRSTYIKCKVIRPGASVNLLSAGHFNCCRYICVMHKQGSPVIRFMIQGQIFFYTYVRNTRQRFILNSGMPCCSSISSLFLLAKSFLCIAAKKAKKCASTSILESSGPVCLWVYFINSSGDDVLFKERNSFSRRKIFIL